MKTKKEPLHFFHAAPATSKIKVDAAPASISTQEINNRQKF
jgi:hypothetical protein